METLESVRTSRDDRSFSRCNARRLYIRRTRRRGLLRFSATLGPRAAWPACSAALLLSNAASLPPLEAAAGRCARRRHALLARSCTPRHDLQSALLRERFLARKSFTHQRTEKERGEEHQKIRNFDSKDLPQNSMDRDDFSHRLATSRINRFKNKFAKRLSIDHESKITQKYPRK